MKSILILAFCSLFIAGCLNDDATTASSACATAMTTMVEATTIQATDGITQENCEVALQAQDDYCTGVCEPAGTADSMCKIDDGSGTYTDYVALTSEEITAACIIMVAFMGGGL